MNCCHKLHNRFVRHNADGKRPLKTNKFVELQQSNTEGTGDR